MIITIGLPGSGKTTWAKIRTNNLINTNNSILSADLYFEKFLNGFDMSKIGDAHMWCQKEIRKELDLGNTCVANNTNTTLQEMNWYINQIEMTNLPHKIVFVIMPERKIEILLERGQHDVPRKTLINMNKRLGRMLKRNDTPSIQSILKAGPFRRPTNNRGLKLHSDIIYTGIFLDENAANKLRNQFENMTGTPLLSELTDCHLTIFFLPTYKHVNELPIGKKGTSILLLYGVF